MSAVAASSRPDPYALASRAADALRERFGIPGLDSAFVLGSGWSAAADDLGDLIGSCELAEIPGFAKPTVIGHGGALRIVRTGAGRISAIFTGRTHYYEGLGVQQVVHGVRTVAAAGAKIMVLTNGCGGLNPDWPPGTAVLIRDHINLTGATPLLGATFIDLSEAYSKRLRDLVQGIQPLPEGVGLSEAMRYVWLRSEWRGNSGMPDGSPNARTLLAEYATEAREVRKVERLQTSLKHL